jgi:hypothetical protein
MVSAGVSTDLVSLRNLDANSLLRLYDRLKLVRNAARTLSDQDRLRRTLDRIVRELGRQGVRV